MIWGGGDEGWAGIRTGEENPEILTNKTHALQSSHRPKRAGKRKFRREKERWTW